MVPTTVIHINLIQNFALIFSTKSRFYFQGRTCFTSSSICILEKWILMPKSHIGTVYSHTRTVMVSLAPLKYLALPIRTFD